jgi:hypothetical protein
MKTLAMKSPVLRAMPLHGTACTQNKIGATLYILAAIGSTFFSVKAVGYCGLIWRSTAASDVAGRLWFRTILAVIWPQNKMAGSRPVPGIFSF